MLLEQFRTSPCALVAPFYPLYLILLKLHSIECAVIHLEKKKIKHNQKTYLLCQETPPTDRCPHVPLQQLLSAMRQPPSDHPIVLQALVLQGQNMGWEILRLITCLSVVGTTELGSPVKLVQLILFLL